MIVVGGAHLKEDPQTAVRTIKAARCEARLATGLLAGCVGSSPSMSDPSVKEDNAAAVTPASEVSAEQIAVDKAASPSKV